MRFDLFTFLLLMLLALLWGGSFFFAEIALSALPPLTIAFLRVCFALPVLAIILWLQGERLPRSAQAWGAFLVMGALNNTLPFSLIFWGQQWLSSGVASILNGTTAMFGALIAAAFLKDEPLTANRILGAVLGLLGVVAIIGPSAIGGLNISNLAQLAVLLAAVSYALASVWGRLHLGAYPPLVCAFGMVASSSVLTLPLAITIDGLPLTPIASSIWAAVLGLSLLSTAFAYMLYFTILARAGAANLMLVTLLIPPVATALGVLFLQEPVTGAQILGFAVIGFGLLVTDGRILGRDRISPFRSKKNRR